MSVSVGFFGKIPSRGDFLRFRLPDATIAVLDDWVARNLASRLRRHGAEFDAIWERAPIWRFSLDAGRLDPSRAATGIWMPSIDRAGRCFPLLLVALHPPGRSALPVLDALQPVLQTVLLHDQPPEMLQSAIDEAAWPSANQDRDPGDLWWRPSQCDGTPVLLRSALPDGEGFDLLLRLLPRETAPPVS